ncbi:MAG: YvrJ family protein [Caldisericia bacterium]|nr:YvrJ family protein [Caldisericia bacterium]
MEIDLLIKLISQVGFPIVVATFLLLRTNGKIDKLKDAIMELKNSIDLLKDELIKKD